MNQGVAFSLLLFLTGSFNVLYVKWADNLKTECSDGKLRHFQHPVVLTMLMFFGEMLCFVIYKMLYILLGKRGLENEHIITRGGREFSPMSMLLPSFLDATGSLLLFTGLYLTYATSFQMIRSAALIFVGLFSSIYLNQTLTSRHWLAMFTISCGITTIISLDVQRVEYDRTSLSHADYNAILTGDLLIIFAQVFHSIQFVYEEKQIKVRDLPPMQVIGWQGIFGILITSAIGSCLHFLPSPMPFSENTRGVFDDLGDLWTQLSGNKYLLLGLFAFIISCSIYNYVALAVTKFSSVTNRLVADGLCIIFIWLFVLVNEWEYMNLITIMGFIILQLGIISYRNAIFLEWYRALLGRWQRAYMDLGNDSGVVTCNHAADVI